MRHRHKRSNHPPPPRAPEGMRHRCSTASGHCIDRAIFLIILSRRRVRKDLYLRHRILRRKLNNAAIHIRLGRHRPGSQASAGGPGYRERTALSGDTGERFVRRDMTCAIGQFRGDNNYHEQ
ncbi:uncharacterized protein H6S33_008883 [Morchella sextelata]|uniref:uncharacterized protein n=1 Tax=Morchella sextelata TaxID=1174677 RepID=UPI001D042B56|nr:uncharacterized protein H6S33_008883 [Morchella sextelata]KAH0612503.1 hypothetical protein H6S33_008883 [Morchella sextelata]